MKNCLVFFIINVLINAAGLHAQVPAFAKFSTDRRILTTENVEDVTNNFAFTISPNAAISFINITVQNLHVNSIIRVMNKTGNIFIEKEITSGTSVHQVDVSTLPKGMYYVFIQDGNNILSKNFIKQ